MFIFTCKYLDPWLFRPIGIVLFIASGVFENLTIDWIKIHPAIGIARLGNSPDEYFIGPEIPGDRSIPPGGYKDSKCMIKRQAAQFHIFAHHSDGSATEIQS